MNTVLPKNTQLLPYALVFYFAYFNRGGKDEIEVASAKWESKIAKCRSLMLTSNKLPSVELEEVSIIIIYLYKVKFLDLQERSIIHIRTIA